MAAPRVFELKLLVVTGSLRDIPIARARWIETATWTVDVVLGNDTPESVVDFLAWDFSRDNLVNDSRFPWFVFIT